MPALEARDGNGLLSVKPSVISPVYVGREVSHFLSGYADRELSLSHIKDIINSKYYIGSKRTSQKLYINTIHNPGA